MEGLVIFFVAAGVLAIAASFFMKEKETKDPEANKEFAQELWKEEIRNQLSVMTDDMLENAEAKLDQMANQKIMAVGNYSEDVLKNIEDNHNEVMFLYNMLNDKENTLKNTVRDIEAVKVSVKKMSEEQPDLKEKSEVVVQKQAKNLQKISKNDRTNQRGNRKKETQTEKSRQDKKQTAMQMKDEILRQYKNGRTNVEIAQELGLGVGEVNLILELFR